jgi:hypothetical protein
MPLAWICLIGGGSVAAARLSAKHATMGMLSSLTSPAETSDNVSLLKHNMGGPSDDVSEVHKKSGQVLLGLVLTNQAELIYFRSNASIGIGRLEA